MFVSCLFFFPERLCKLVAVTQSCVVPGGVLLGDPISAFGWVLFWKCLFTAAGAWRSSVDAGDKRAAEGIKRARWFCAF